MYLENKGTVVTTILLVDLIEIAIKINIMEYKRKTCLLLFSLFINHYLMALFIWFVDF